MPPTKARITNVSVSDPQPTEVLFNPTDYSITRGANYASVDVPGLSMPILQFVRGESQTLQLELLLDGTDGRTDVHDRLETLRSLVQINRDLHTPPIVQFNWGHESFRGVVTQLNERMTLFNQDGDVLRSRVAMTFKSYESVETQMRQTARSSPDRTRTRVLREGETLAHVAFEVYGDPSMWRVIAAENGLERPRFVAPGTVLVVPAV
jgi:hypothetical protein